MMIDKLLMLICAFFLTAESCSRYREEDLCATVRCPEGLRCQQDASYSCGNFVCRAVAVCGDITDPCQTAKCPAGYECVKVKDPNNCGDNQPCQFIAECKATNRPGKCPTRTDDWVTSCSLSCTDSDVLCEEGAKCCYIDSLRSKYCIHAEV